MSLPVTQNTLNCFDDIITLDGCGNQVSTSGFTLNADLGMTLSEINQYINKEYENGSQLFLAKKSFAIRQIANQVHQYLQPQYKANTLVDGKRVGMIQENLQTQTGVGNSWAGQKINIVNNNSWLELYISEVSIMANYTGDIEVRIYNLQTGGILKDAAGNDFTFIIQAVAGEPSTVFPQIAIPCSKKDLNIAIVYNATGTTPYQLSLTSIPGSCAGCNPCSSTRYSKVTGITIPTGSSIIDQNTVKQNYTGGMSVVYSVNCNYNGWLCSIGNLIAPAVLFKTGAEIMDYAINNSDRLNKKTLIDYENLVTRRDEYQGRFAQAMSNMLTDKIKVPNDNNCFECNKRILHTYALPG